MDHRQVAYQRLLRSPDSDASAEKSGRTLTADPPDRFGLHIGLDSRHRLAALFGATSGRAGFSAKRTAAPGDLRIDVAGVGPLELPVSPAQARQLCAIARPARCGVGEQTLTDSRVRHTWEVPKNRVRIDQRRWNRTLLPILAAQGMMVV